MRSRTQGRSTRAASALVNLEKLRKQLCGHAVVANPNLFGLSASLELVAASRYFNKSMDNSKVVRYLARNFPGNFLKSFTTWQHRTGY